MKKDRFDDLCMETESGNDAFVKNPDREEEGRVLECSAEHLVVETATGDHRCWDFHDCDEMSRTKNEWPYR